MAKYEIKEVLTEEPWEEFLLDREHTPFLQSWAWGEFQEELGLSHRRFGLYEGDSLQGVCLALVGQRKLGSFVYTPHGPVLKKGKEKEAESFLEYLVDFSSSQGVDYLRVEPNWQPRENLKKIFLQRGFKKSNTPTVQAGGRTLIVDLETPEEDLLMDMRKNTRYLVRKAREAGVKVERTSDPDKMAEFHRLMEATKERQGFVAHSRKYLQSQFEALSKRRMAELSLTKFEGNVLAASITISYGDTVSYVHGASTRGDVPASHFLLWENIREAKEDEYKYFDLWGIAPEGASSDHPWYGYTLFKKGFGGYPVNYIGSWDYSFTPRYWAVSSFEKIRKVIRGL